MSTCSLSTKPAKAWRPAGDVQPWGYEPETEYVSCHGVRETSNPVKQR